MRRLARIAGRRCWHFSTKCPSEARGEGRLSARRFVRGALPATAEVGSQGGTPSDYRREGCRMPKDTPIGSLTARLRPLQFRAGSKGPALNCNGCLQTRRSVALEPRAVHGLSVGRKVRLLLGERASDELKSHVSERRKCGAAEARAAIQHRLLLNVLSWAYLVLLRVSRMARQANSRFGMPRTCLLM